MADEEQQQPRRRNIIVRALDAVIDRIPLVRDVRDRLTVSDEEAARHAQRRQERILARDAQNQIVSRVDGIEIETAAPAPVQLSEEAELLIERVRLTATEREAELLRRNLEADARARAARQTPPVNPATPAPAAHPTVTAEADEFDPHLLRDEGLERERILAAARSGVVEADDDVVVAETENDAYDGPPVQIAVVGAETIERGPQADELTLVEVVPLRPIDLENDEVNQTPVQVAAVGAERIESTPHEELAVVEIPPVRSVVIDPPTELAGADIPQAPVPPAPPAVPPAVAVADAGARTTPPVDQGAGPVNLQRQVALVDTLDPSQTTVFETVNIAQRSVDLSTYANVYYEFPDTQSGRTIISPTALDRAQQLAIINDQTIPYTNLRNPMNGVMSAENTQPLGAPIGAATGNNDEAVRLAEAARIAERARQAELLASQSLRGLTPPTPTVAPVFTATVNAEALTAAVQPDVALASLSGSSLLPSLGTPPQVGLPAGAPDPELEQEIIVTARASMLQREMVRGNSGRLERISDGASAIIFNEYGATDDDRAYMRSVAAIMTGTADAEINPAHLARYRREIAQSDTTSYSQGTLQDGGIFDRQGRLGRTHAGSDLYLVSEEGQLLDTHALLDASSVSPALYTTAPAAVIYAGITGGRSGGGGLSVQVAYERINEQGVRETVVDNILHMDLERGRRSITPSVPVTLLRQFRETRDENQFMVLPQGTHIGDIGGSGLTLTGGLDDDRHRRPHMHIERSIIPMPLSEFLALSRAQKNALIGANLVNPMSTLAPDHDIELRPTRSDYTESLREQQRLRRETGDRRDVIVEAREDFGLNAQVSGSTLDPAMVNFRESVTYTPDIEGVPVAPADPVVIANNGATITLTSVTLGVGAYNQNSIDGTHALGFMPGATRVVE